MFPSPQHDEGSVALSLGCLKMFQTCFSQKKKKKSAYEGSAKNMTPCSFNLKTIRFIFNIVAWGKTIIGCVYIRLVMFGLIGPCSHCTVGFLSGPVKFKEIWWGRCWEALCCKSRFMCLMVLLVFLVQLQLALSY